MVDCAGFSGIAITTVENLSPKEVVKTGLLSVSASLRGSLSLVLCARHLKDVPHLSSAPGTSHTNAENVFLQNYKVSIRPVGAADLVLKDTLPSMNIE